MERERRGTDCQERDETKREERKKMDRGSGRGECCSSQPHLSDEVWGLAISEAALLLCSPNEYYLPLNHPCIGTRETAHTVSCCQDCEEEPVQYAVGLSLSVAGSYLIAGDVCVWLCSSDANILWLFWTQYFGSEVTQTFATDWWFVKYLTVILNWQSTEHFFMLPSTAPSGSKAMSGGAADSR